MSGGHWDRLWVCLCLAAIATGLTGARAQETAPSPASGPAPLPHDLGLDDQDRRLLSQVFDRNARLSDPALAALLGRIEGLSPLPPAQWPTDLDLPGYGNILAQPDRYRARPIRLSLRVGRVQEMTPGQKTTPADLRPWPRADGKPLWWVECFDASADNPGHRPLILLSIIEPPLPAGKDDPQGGRMYPKLPPLEAVAALYKIYSWVDRDGQDRDYPLLLAWQLEPPTSSRPASGTKVPSQQVMLVGLVLMVGFGLMYLRRRQARVRHESQPSYQPRRWRYQPPDAPAQRADDPANPTTKREPPSHDPADHSS